MALVANNPAASKRLGIPQKVGKEFVEADKGRKFARGGEMKESKEMMKKEVSFMKKKGAPKSMIKHEMAEAKGKPFAKGGVTRADGVVSKGHTKGKMVKMAYGGKAC